MVRCTNHVRQRLRVARAAAVFAASVGVWWAGPLRADIVSTSGQPAGLRAALAPNVANPTSPGVVGLASAGPDAQAASGRSQDDAIASTHLVRRPHAGLIFDPLAAHPAVPLPRERAVAEGNSSEGIEIRVPASPGSLTVAVSSLLTLGGWRLVRQARQIQLGALPEWYSVGGPDQVGRATAFVPGTDMSVLSVCWYQPDWLCAVRQMMAHYWWPERCAVRESSYFIPTCAPRAPPHSS